MVSDIYRVGITRIFHHIISPYNFGTSLYGSNIKSSRTREKG